MSLWPAGESVHRPGRVWRRVGSSWDHRKLKQVRNFHRSVALAYLFVLVKLTSGSVLNSSGVVTTEYSYRDSVLLRYPLPDVSNDDTSSKNHLSQEMFPLLDTTFHFEYKFD